LLGPDDGPSVVMSDGGGDVLVRRSWAIAFLGLLLMVVLVALEVLARVALA